MRKFYSMAKNLLLDTGFWYALYDERDSHYEGAQILAELLLDFNNLVIPWPSLYETLNTRFIRRRAWLESFATYLTRINTVRLPDEMYRQYALGSVLRNQTRGRSLSLVDAIIRLALEDPDVKIDAMVTFNQADFYDTCASRNIELISD